MKMVPKPSTILDSRVILLIEEKFKFSRIYLTFQLVGGPKLYSFTLQEKRLNVLVLNFITHMLSFEKVSLTVLLQMTK